VISGTVQSEEETIGSLPYARSKTAQAGRDAPI